MQHIDKYLLSYFNHFLFFWLPVYLSPPEGTFFFVHRRASISSITSSTGISCITGITNMTRTIGLTCITNITGITRITGISRIDTIAGITGITGNDNITCIIVLLALLLLLKGLDLLHWSKQS